MTDKLKYYLNTGLIGSYFSETRSAYVNCELSNLNIHNFNPEEFSPYKPVAYRLSDLGKQITVPGYNNDEPFIPLFEIQKKLHNGKHLFAPLDIDSDFTFQNAYGFSNSVRDLPFNIIEKLTTWHFWLWSEDFDKGLVIDKMTLNEKTK